MVNVRTSITLLLAVCMLCGVQEICTAQGIEPGQEAESRGVVISQRGVNSSQSERESRASSVLPLNTFLTDRDASGSTDDYRTPPTRSDERAVAVIVSSGGVDRRNDLANIAGHFSFGDGTGFVDGADVIRGSRSARTNPVEIQGDFVLPSDGEQSLPVEVGTLWDTETSSLNASGSNAVPTTEATPSEGSALTPESE